MILGGVVLCGGLSTRMGVSKAWLPCGAEPMLARVVRLLSAVANPIVVVAAAGQELPPLPESVRIVRDARDRQGPLEGLRAGLAELIESGLPPSAAAYVTGCDVPLLVPAFANRLAALLDDFDSVVPTECVVPAKVVDEPPVEVANTSEPEQRSTPRTAFRHRDHPLAAVYRLAILPEVERLLASDQRRMTSLLEHVRTRRVPVDDLRDVDPRLDSLLNLNRPADYEQALRRMSG